ncbi:MAG: PHB depolymerase family esterase [Solirubrobacteraceae bacterium]
MLHLPPVVSRGRSLALVIALHGANQNATFFEPYTGFSRIADSEGFAVLYPNAYGSRAYWNINDQLHAPDDVQFVSDAIDAAATLACLDPSRIYATGVSNGGGMAARLGCQLAGRLAAIAPVAGGYRSLPACRPRGPVSVLEVHGTNDGVVLYFGASGSTSYADGQGAVSAFLSGWLGRDRCRSKPMRRSRLAPQVIAERWLGCPAGLAVEHLQIVGGEHQLPGGLPPDPGQRSTVSTPWQIWRFFRGHHR